MLNFFGASKSKLEQEFAENVKNLKAETPNMVTNLQRTSNLIVKGKAGENLINPEYTQMLFQKHHCLNAIAKIQMNLKTASQESEAKFETLFVDNDFINVFL